MSDRDRDTGTKPGGRRAGPADAPQGAGDAVPDQRERDGMQAASGDGQTTAPPRPGESAHDRRQREAAEQLDRDRRRLDRRGTGQRTREVREAIRDELSTGTHRTARPEGTAVIELQDVSLAFDRPILEDISFAAHEGQTIVVVGESGTGKSTLLKLILRLLIPDKGRVLVDGEDISCLSFEEALEVRQKMGMVFQGAALFDSMTVFENIAYPLREHTDLTEDEIEARVREKLQFVDLEPDEVLEKLPAELSGGMKKRVGIARGMANNPEVMLYDEPTSGLDPLTTGTITRLIMKLQRELKVTSIVVSHDIRSANRMASRIALLAENRIRFFGTPEEMAASEDEYIQSFLGGL
jgi:phospholipid/cholesterol/gamma-HCH transport system ATP-binding protein